MAVRSKPWFLGGSTTIGQKHNVAHKSVDRTPNPARCKNTAHAAPIDRTDACTSREFQLTIRKTEREEKKNQKKSAPMKPFGLIPILVLLIIGAALTMALGPDHSRGFWALFCRLWHSNHGRGNWCHCILLHYYHLLSDSCVGNFICDAQRAFSGHCWRCLK